MRTRSPPILQGSIFLLLCLPFLLAGCGLEDAIISTDLPLPLKWLNQNWLFFAVWALPAWVFYEIGSSGYTPTSRASSNGHDAYGNPITINIDIPTGPYVPGEPKSGHTWAGWWLLAFPLGYVLYPWYSQLWWQAGQSTLTPYPNLNWHLIKWFLPLSAAALLYGLARSVVRYKNQDMVSKITLAGHRFIWLLVALAAVWPAFLLLTHLLEKPESTAMVAAPEIAVKPLPTQPANLKIPENGEFDPYATQLWTCKTGFEQVGNSCRKR